MNDDDKARRAHLRRIIKTHLEATGEIAHLEGMARDANIIDGELVSWEWRVALSTGERLLYTMDNRDGAPVLRDGEEVEL